MTTAARRARYFQAARRRYVHPWTAWTKALEQKEEDVSEQSGFDPQWCILELMGHRRLGGYVSEATIAGAAMLRIDVPGPDGTTATQFYGGSSVYCLSPVSEELARAVALRNQPAPVSRFELPRVATVEDTSEYEGNGE